MQFEDAVLMPSVQVRNSRSGLCSALTAFQPNLCTHLCTSVASIHLSSTEEENSVR